MKKTIIALAAILAVSPAFAEVDEWTKRHTDEFIAKTKHLLTPEGYAQWVVEFKKSCQEQVIHQYDIGVLPSGSDVARAMANCKWGDE